VGFSEGLKNPPGYGKSFLISIFFTYQRSLEP
jgi:hypothetical protein